MCVCQANTHFCDEFLIDITLYFRRTHRVLRTLAVDLPQLSTSEQRQEKREGASDRVRDGESERKREQDRKRERGEETEWEMERVRERERTR